MTGWNITIEIYLEDGIAEDDDEAINAAIHRVHTGDWDAITTEPATVDVTGILQLFSLNVTRLCDEEENS